MNPATGTARAGNIARRVEKMMTTCQHFRGIDRSPCAAGVNLLDVTKYDAGAHRLPCLPKYAGAALGCCEKFSTLTAEEAQVAAEARERDLYDFIGHMSIARRAITDATGNKGGAGAVPCPKCGGTLRYSQAASNKHVHARCETAGCLAWME
jgi:hypothetical protein